MTTGKHQPDPGRDGVERAGGAEKPALLVSACLLGVECNHEGAAAKAAETADTAEVSGSTAGRTLRDVLSERYRLVPVCPEVVGGLPTPRAAAEIQGGDGHDVLAGRSRVLDVEGDDVTDAYLRGARAAVAAAQAAGATRAVLKARSPSCGSDGIYDGTFSRTVRAGSGVTAAALAEAAIEVRSDEDDLPEGSSVPGDRV